MTATEREHDVDPRYDEQSGYGVADSYYGDGKYPPDWDRRREAVWERQRYQCGRCGAYKGDVSVAEVHHVVHLADGGSNELGNLVGLCGDCHAMMHPDVDDLRGTHEHAAVFPSEYAADGVAVLRSPRGNPELSTDLARLSTFSSPDANARAVTEVSVPTSARTAKRAERDLHDLLVDRGYVPRTSAYHRVRVVPQHAGLLGAVYPASPDLTVSGDGTASEVDDGASADRIDAYYTSDFSRTEVDITDATGTTRSERVWFDGREEGSRFRIEKPVDRPAITPSTAPAYAVGVARGIGWPALKRGAVPALLVAWLLPSLVPFGGSLLGGLLLALLVGLLLGAPDLYRTATAERRDRVVNEATDGPPAE